jgi:hypothetical protein
MITQETAGRLALMGALTAVFDSLHQFFDHWTQSDRDARLKGLHGDQKVWADGTPVGDEIDDRSGQPTFTASQVGRRAAARHAGTYTAGQLAATVAVTRALGYRVPARALLAGALINFGTHALIDRRDPLHWLADRAGKRGYIDHCHAVRLARKTCPECGITRSYVPSARLGACNQCAGSPGTAARTSFT